MGVENMGIGEVDRRTFMEGGVFSAIEILNNAFSLASGEKMNYQDVYITMEGLEEPVTIVGLGDTHIDGEGPMDNVDVELCEEIGEKIAEKLLREGVRPEETILAFTGDGGNATRNVTRVERLKEGFQKLMDFPFIKALGVFGNHDDNHVHSREILKTYGEVGMEMLAFDGMMGWYEQNGVLFLGLPDFTTHENLYTDFPIKEYVELLKEKNMPMVILSHNASILDIAGLEEALRDHKPGVVVMSGHTHRGQSSGRSVLQWLMRAEALRRIDYKSKYIGGRYRFGKHGDVYVTGGLGSAGAPIRTAMREVVFIHLVPA